MERSPHSAQRSSTHLAAEHNVRDVIPLTLVSAHAGAAVHAAAHAGLVVGYVGHVHRVLDRGHGVDAGDRLACVCVVL